ncbi:MAG: glycosyltransferase family 4 protein, partial [Acidobacteria bacterium]|nr:glycosyltransferase family 4 protein [Acidobacteriota bacterium]
MLVARDGLAASQRELVRDLAAQGALIVGWQHSPLVQERFPSPDVASWLQQNAIAARPLGAILGESVSVEIDEAVIAWMKAFGRAPLSDRGNFRDIFRYRNLPLWWWAELYLYHDTPLRLYLRDIEALARLLESERPDRLVVVAPVRELAEAARALSERVEVHGE